MSGLGYGEISTLSVERQQNWYHCAYTDSRIHIICSAAAYTYASCIPVRALNSQCSIDAHACRLC